MKLYIARHKLQMIFVNILLCYGLSACKKPVPEDMQPSKKAEEITVKINNDLDSICAQLKDDMLSMSAERTTFALEQINQNIRLCLPLMPLNQQIDLIDVSNQMYKQFLAVDRTIEQQKLFDQYVHDQAQYPTIQQSQLEKLTARDQYLLQHKGQAYIEIADTENHETFYKRSIQYLAKVFAPYFPEAEKTFIQELANQNQETHFNARDLNIQAQEISRRAQFWEDYVSHYPQSHYVKDAEFLYHFYSGLLFTGLKSAPVSTYYCGEIDIEPHSLTEIKLLSQKKNSRLADQARSFMKFIEMTPEQRSIEIPLSIPHTISEPKKTSIQLNHFLNLRTYDLNNLPLDCFSDAVCTAKK